ncbi:hypothetical protein ABTJ98_20640, partial [Acinetobacter baumannii]
GGALVAWGGLGYRLDSVVDPGGPSNPRFSTTVAEGGAWLRHYGAHPWMLLAPLLGFLGPVLALLGIRARRDVLVFAGSSLANIGII